MTVGEQVVTIACDGELMRGVVNLPEECRGVGVLFVVGGPQYRVGSHRQQVLLARALAAAGYPCLRFDVRGMGDSDGRPRDFESITRDIGAAVDAASAAANIERIVLWGLCDGASAALLYVHETADRRIAGLMLANPWVRSDESLAQTQLRHYYKRRLVEPGFWSDLIRGRIGRDALYDLLRNLRLGASGLIYRSAARPTRAQYDFREKMAHSWRQFGGPILLLLSGEDYTAKEFIHYTASRLAWRDALVRDDLDIRSLAGVDHTFSSQAALVEVIDSCLEWLIRSFPDSNPRFNQK